VSTPLQEGGNAAYHGASADGIEAGCACCVVPCCRCVCVCVLLLLLCVLLLLLLLCAAAAAVDSVCCICCFLVRLKGLHACCLAVHSAAYSMSKTLVCNAACHLLLQDQRRMKNLRS
jgi:hypothetical protein